MAGFARSPGSSLKAGLSDEMRNPRLIDRTGIGRQFVPGKGLRPVVARPRTFEAQFLAIAMAKNLWDPIPSEQQPVHFHSTPP